MDLLRSFQLAWCREFAATRGGECLSEEYVGAHAPMEWQCALGHRWRAAFKQVLDVGSWCPTCGHERRGMRMRIATLAKVRAIAAKKGGVCLTPSVDVRGKLRFRCALGHEWGALSSSVVLGTWCKKCGNVRAPTRRKEKKFRSVLAIARRHGGECLSTTYANVWAKARWRCREGHEWVAAFKQIGDGQWCPRCAGVARHTLEELVALARDRGGECLSTVYRDARTPLEWSCAAGHRWKATATNAIHQGTWCPRCYGAPRDDLARLQAIARRRGGKCLARRYRKSDVRVRWQCREGHEWLTKAAHVVKGTWCPECGRLRGPRPTRTLQDMVDMASSRGGECLSEAYVNSQTRLRWRCARGHEWRAVPASLRRGSWCPECASSVRGTIDGLRARAAELGGRCLSATYDDPRVPLKWVCQRGHRFEALAKAVKSGVWCPKCRTGPTPKGPRRSKKPIRGSKASTG